MSYATNNHTNILTGPKVTRYHWVSNKLGQVYGQMLRRIIELVFLIQLLFQRFVVTHNHFIIGWVV